MITSTETPKEEFVLSSTHYSGLPPVRQWPSSRKRPNLSASMQHDPIDRPLKKRPLINPFTLYKEPSESSTELHFLQERKLCDSCATIDFEEALFRRAQISATDTIKNLGPVVSWKLKRCLFCDFVFNLLSPEAQEYVGADVEYIVRSFWSKTQEGETWQSLDITGLMISQEGWAVEDFDTWFSQKLSAMSRPRISRQVRLFPQYLQANHLAGSQGIPLLLTLPMEFSRDVCPLDIDSVRFSALRQWLKDCDKLHTTCCSSLQETPDIRLIDCETGRLVLSNDDPYVTLSYVWGRKAVESVNKEEHTSCINNVLPKLLPETIKDAITATKELGFRFLWIDKYCIDQEDEEDRHKQIQQMDLIYKNSALTIVAAAGDNSSYGLPGVGRRCRTPQPRLQIDPHTLLLAIDDSKFCIEESTWASRAWTYQEGLLSKRRLVFTDQQVYFECQGFYCTEALGRPAKSFWKKDPSIRDNYGQWGIFPRDGVGDRPYQILDRIAEYSKRILSYPNDILNGILGIFRVFETNSNLQVRHLWGVPYSNIQVDGHPDSTIDPLCIQFLEGLSWSAVNNSGRRKGFPSWSWTGWSSEIYWHKFTPSNDGRLGKSAQATLNFKIKIELLDGQFLSWEDYNKSYGSVSTSSLLSNYLHISAYTTPIMLKSIPDRWPSMDNSNKYAMQVWAGDGKFCELGYFAVVDASICETESYLGIHLGEGLSDYTCLIVRGIDSAWERVGICLFNATDVERVKMCTTWETIRLG